MSEIQALDRVKDRLETTNSDQLESVLNILLPKLLILSSNEDLREKLLSIFTIILRRCKSLNTILPISKLIRLFSSDHFICNFSITFIDTSIEYHPESYHEECGIALIESLKNFNLFSMQSNVLNYYSLFFLNNIQKYSIKLKEESLVNSMYIDNQLAYDVIGDWLLDICITQGSISKLSAVGSIQPGLSINRSSRLTFKKETWDINDLKRYKLLILNNISNISTTNNLEVNIDVDKRFSWLSSPYSVAISIVCSCDNDTDVALNAYSKVNGAKNLFDVDENAEIVIEFLLHLCAPSLLASPISLSLNNTSNIDYSRLHVRTDVKCAIIRWMCKELKQYFHLKISTTICKFLFSEIFQSNLNIRYSLSLLTLMNILLDKLNDIELKPLYVLFFASIQRILLPYASKMIANNEKMDNDSTDVITIREVCYQIIEKTSIKSKELATKQYDLFNSLFNLLHFENEAIIPKLYSALGILRLSFENTDVTLDAGSVQLQELLNKGRLSSEVKIRYESIQWCKSLFHWSPFVLETMILLSNDTSQVISKFISIEFIKLREELTNSAQLTCVDTVNTLENHSLVDILSSNQDSVTSINNNNIHISKIKSNGTTNCILDSLIEFITISPHIFNISQRNDTLDSPINTIKSIDSSSVGIRKIAIIEVLTTINSSLMSIINLHVDDYQNKNVFIIQQQLSEINVLSDKIILSLLIGLTSMLSYHELFNDKVMMKKSVPLIKNCLLLNKSDNTRLNCRSNLHAYIMNWYDVDDSSINLIVDCLGLYSYDADLDYLSDLIQLLILQLDTPTHMNGAMESLSSLLQALIENYQKKLSSHKDTEILIKKLTKELLIKIEKNLLLDSSERNLIIVATRSFSKLTSERYYKVILSLFDSNLNNDFNLSDTIDNILQSLLVLIDNSNVSLSSSAIYSLTKSSMSYSLLYKTWFKLLDLELIKNDNLQFKFALAEGLSRISFINSPVIYQSNSKNNEIDFTRSADPILCELPILVGNLFEFCENLLESTTGIKEKHKEYSCISIILLVFVNQFSIDLNNKSDSNISNNIIIRAADMFLILFKEKDTFIHDICSIGLCKLFNIAKFNEYNDINNCIKISINQSNNMEVDLVDNEEIVSTSNIISSKLASKIMNMFMKNDHSITQFTTRSDSIETPVQRTTETTETTDISVTNTYLIGIYIFISKLAKKISDETLIFSVFSFIRHQNIYNLGDTENLLNPYKSIQLDLDKGKLKSLIPLLFMARYDPSTNIQSFMRLYWDNYVLVKHNDVIKSSTNEIIIYLKHNLTSRSWHERESTCLALVTVLSKQEFNNIINHAEELWCKGLFLIDDYKPSTRVAALSYMKSLADLFLIACDPNINKNNIVMLDMILPLIIDKGLTNPSSEVKGFSLGVMIQMIELCKHSLKHWLSKLINVLVECMSALEPNVFAFMQFHTSTLNISEEELEKIRMKVSKESPMQEALDQCLSNLDSSNMLEVVTNLCNILNKGVGLATRCSAVNSLSFIAEKYTEFSKFSGKSAYYIYSVLINSPRRSPTLTKTFLSGLGALIKVTPVILVEDICNSVINSFKSLKGDDKELTLTVVNCFQEIVNKAGDNIVNSSIWTDILSCSYIGSFDEDIEIKQLWSKVFSDSLSYSGSGTKFSAIQRIYTVVIDMINLMLVDLSWFQRRQSLYTLSDLIISISSEQMINQLGNTLKLLFSYLIPSQIWNGQSMILEVIVCIVIKCKSQLELDFSNKNIEKQFLLNLYSNQDFEVFRLNIEDMLKLANSNRQMLSINSSSVTIESTPIETEIKSSNVYRSMTNQDQQDFSINKDINIINWKISFASLVVILLHEASRGDKAYRTIAARSISQLPWKYISSLSPEIFDYFLPSFCMLSGIPLDSSLILPIEGFNSLIIKKENNIIESINKKTSSSKVVNRSMFGSRYGNNITKVVNINNKRNISSIESPVKITSHSSDIIDVKEIIVMENVIDGNNVIIEKDIEITIPPVLDMTTLISSSEILIQSIDNQLYKTQHDITSNGFLSNKNICFITDDTKYTDLLYRLKFIDTIAQGWAKNISSSINIEFKLIKSIFLWIFHSIRVEIWSIRLGAYELLQALLPLLDLVEFNYHDEVLESIKIGIEDIKYSKIRVSALNCLYNFILIFQDEINNKQSNQVLKNKSEIINSILRISSADSDKTILQISSKIQQIWYKYIESN